MSKKSVVILIVSKDIQDDVARYVDSIHLNIRTIVNITPTVGAGRDSISGASSANTYAICAKDTGNSYIYEPSIRICLSYWPSPNWSVFYSNL